MASLHILKGPNKGDKVTLGQEKTTLGRNPECTVVIPVNAVSREHANILRIQGRYYIEDLKSRNKTYVNNQPVEVRTPLKNKDQIRICDFLAEFFDNSRSGEDDDDHDDHDDQSLEEGSSTTVEATLGRGSNLQLETQPADRLKLLLDISSTLSRTLELDRLLPQIVDSMFMMFKQADRCFIILTEDAIGKSGEVTKRLMPKVVKTRRPQDESTARFSKTIVRRCLETADAFLSDDALGSMPLNQSVVDFRIRSVMCVPLSGGEGKPFGVIQLDTQDRNKKFTQDDLRLLRGVADQASVSLENAKMHESVVARERYQRDMALAYQVQLSFLPKSLPKVAGYEFFAHYEPAQEVGGDYYGFIPVPGRRLAVLVGDVAGKGVPAALLMAKLSSDARFCLLTEEDPAAAINRLNDLLYQHTSQMDRFVTLTAAILDPRENVVTLVNAGHVTPLIFRAVTKTLTDAMPNELAGVPLGIMEAQNYASCHIPLEPGDSLLLYTDGVCDAVNTDGVRFENKGIETALHGNSALTPHAVGEHIVNAVKHHSLGRSAADDITLVCLGRIPT